MILLDVGNIFDMKMAPYLGAVIGVLVVIVGFFLTMFMKDVKDQLKGILATLNIYFATLKTAETQIELLKTNQTNLDKRLDACGERNCVKIFNLEIKLDKLDKVVQEHNNSLLTIMRNHNRNHPEDK